MRTRAGAPQRLTAPLLLLAYGAGLATGLARFWVPACALALLPLLLLRRSAASAAALATGAALLGTLAGAIARGADALSCRARLGDRQLELTLRLAEPADSAGGPVLVTLPGAPCRGAVGARWPQGTPALAGSEARAFARWIRRPALGGRADGVLVVRAARILRAAPTPIDRLRNAVQRASAELYGRRAGLIDALIVGRRGGMDRTETEHFADAGLVHILSISGFHVGLIAAWLVLLLRAAGCRREPALLAAAALSSLYILFLGCPAPAARAGALAWAMAITRASQRHVGWGAVLATTCLGVLLLDPWAVFDLGAWLSALSLWGATSFTRWGDRALGARVHWRTLAGSSGATLATAPVTAFALGKVALVGVALNLAAIPLAAVAVPGAALSLILFFIAPALAAPLAAGSGLALHLLERLADLGAAVPLGHVVAEPGLAAAAPWAVALGLALWAIGRRNTLPEAARRLGWVAVVVAWTFFGRSLAGATSSDLAGGLTLHFLDVGQGDAAVLRTPGGHWIAIDAGPRGGPAHLPDEGRRVVVPFLLAHGARALSALVLSHAHADHIGGAASVLDRLETGMVLEPGERVTDPVYDELLDAIDVRGVRWHAGRPGERFEIDGVRFTLLHPDPRWTHWGEDLNEDSLVLLVEYGRFRALFAGDAGFPAESVLAGRVGDVSLLKVGHHGSRGSSGERWLGELRPEVAVVSVGARNSYGHPSADALERIRARGASVWRTDQRGTVSVTTDGQSMTVSGRGRRETYTF